MYNREDKAVEIDAPDQFTQPSSTGKVGSHELTHALEFAPFADGHLASDAYVSNTTIQKTPVRATDTEIRNHDLMKDARSVIEGGREIDVYWDPE